MVHENCSGSLFHVLFLLIHSNSTDLFCIEACGTRELLWPGNGLFMLTSFKVFGLLNLSELVVQNRELVRELSWFNVLFRRPSLTGARFLLLFITNTVPSYYDQECFRHFIFFCVETQFIPISVKQSYSYLASKRTLVASKLCC